MIGQNEKVFKAIEAYKQIKTAEELFDKMSLPSNVIIIELLLKNDVEKDDSGILVSKNMITATIPHTDTIVTIPNPTIHLPRGIILKTSSTSKYEIGDIVDFDDKYVFVDPSHNIGLELSKQGRIDNPDTALTFKLRYGFWLNPADRYRTQTNYIMISEHEITNYWRNTNVI